MESKKIPVAIAQYPSPDAYSGMVFQSQGFPLGSKLRLTSFAVFKLFLLDKKADGVFTWSFKGD